MTKTETEISSAKTQHGLIFRFWEESCIKENSSWRRYSCNFFL